MTVDAIIWVWSLFASAPLIGQCDPIDGPKLEWTRAERNEVRRIVQDTGSALGASFTVRAYLDAVTVRESSGAASRWHDAGSGLGAHSVNITTHAKRWPAPLNPAICRPVVSTMVVQDTARDCIVRHSAATILDLQACFAGRFECMEAYTGTKTCAGEQQDRTSSAICGRMEARQSSCQAEISLKDLGQLTPLADRARVAREIERETAN